MRNQLKIIALRLSPAFIQLPLTINYVNKLLIVETRRFIALCEDRVFFDPAEYETIYCS